MYLTAREQERLLVFLAAQLAQRRRDSGLRLNMPEARALIADAVFEGARNGRSVSELMSLGRSILSESDVMEGVRELVDTLMVEPFLPDGQKLVCVHDPITADGMGKVDAFTHRWRLSADAVEINRGRASFSTLVRSLADRPIQVGSHFHFFEVNQALEFDRRRAFGFRLDIPAGTTVRFEPGDEKTVDLVTIGGRREVHGLNRLTEGSLDDPAIRERAFERAAARGYRGI
ncbi:urease subunit beta [Ancylobacter vacuolatus]|uniref:urease subunit beta n=1 Tax=Ancylobacter vacuolatus TaxID=223389 RepID=UPI000F809645|nr:urease subunit beta [Ancylobacter aquaticus]